MKEDIINRSALGPASQHLAEFADADLVQYSPATQRLYALAGEVWGLEPDLFEETLIPSLLAAVQSEDQDLRISAIWAFLWLAEAENRDKIKQIEVIDVLSELCEDPDVGIRRSAIYILMNFQDPRALPALLARLQDEHYRTVYDSIMALGHVGDLRAIPDLSNTLENTNDQILRHAVIHAFGQISDPTAVPTLLSILESEDPLRGFAASSLGEIGDQTVTPRVLQVLQREEEPEVRKWIVHGLGLLGDKRAIQILLIILNDVGADPSKTYETRANTAHALSKLGDEAALPALLKAIDHAPEWQVRVSAVNGISKVTEPAMAAETLVRLLSHDNSYVRGGAAKQLGYLAVSSEDEILKEYVVSALAKSVADTGASAHYALPQVMDEAARSLKEIGTPAALEALKGYEGKHSFGAP